MSVLQNNKEAIKWWTLAANQDFNKAQHNLGIMYYNGIGVTKNLSKSKYWIKKAAENGNENSRSFWNEYELWKY